MVRRDRTYALLLAALAVAADQTTKWWALTVLRQIGGHLGLPGPLDLTFNFNESNAFGLAPVIGHATRWFLMSANLAVAGFLLFLILKRRWRPLTVYGFALIMAGAIGNALDRLLIGAVVDFLDATRIGFVWIFNLADATLDAGIVLVLLGASLSDRRAEA
jgi:signal peptidase II